MYSGLTEFIFRPDLIPFVNVGERCNISGSLLFKKKIVAGKFEEAVQIAKK
jgi:5-methyltetrahydrofolate--homocysteine methyltransferase